MDYPSEVDDDERIVRVVKSPYHFNRAGSLRPAAFKPPKGSDESSVIRWRHATSDARALKAKVREIGESGGGAYKGMTHLTAAACREAGTSIRDSRHLFQGHADLVFPVRTPLDSDPPDAPEHGIIFEITSKLWDARTDVLDPDPGSDDWTIQELPVPAAP